MSKTTHKMTSQEQLETWREILMEMSSKNLDSLANPLISLIDAHKELFQEVSLLKVQKLEHDRQMQQLREDLTRLILHLH